MSPIIYTEDFDHGPRGWMGWVSNAQGAARLEVVDGAIVSRSPWWIDYNHAPPGAGYLQLLFILPTRQPPTFPQQFREAGDENAFVSGNYPTDFRNARVEVRLKGEVAQCGANLVLLIQATVDGKRANHVLIGQPLQITNDWSRQTLDLRPDSSQWLCLGSRHDRQDFYGSSSIESALCNVDVNIIFVLFPVNNVPLNTAADEIHRLRAGEDYAVDSSKLPSGYVMFDEVRIEFSDTESIRD